MNNYEKNINSLHIANKEIKDKYFANGEIIQKIFDVVRRNFMISDSLFGNYASDTIIIINSSSMTVTNIIAEKIKKFYDDNNADFYDIYLTIYEKTINEKINKTLLQKEIEIINPSKVLYLGFDFDYPISALSKVDLDLFISGIDDLNKIKTSEHEGVNKKFISLLKYAVKKNDKINMK